MSASSVISVSQNCCVLLLNAVWKNACSKLRQLRLLVNSSFNLIRNFWSVWIELKRTLVNYSLLSLLSLFNDKVCVNCLKLSHLKSATRMLHFIIFVRKLNNFLEILIKTEWFGTWRVEVTLTYQVIQSNLKKLFHYLVIKKIITMDR